MNVKQFVGTKKLSFHFLRMIVLNSYLLQNKYSNSKRMTLFRFSFCYYQTVNSTQLNKHTELNFSYPKWALQIQIYTYQQNAEKVKITKYYKTNVRVDIVKQRDLMDISYACTHCSGFLALCFSECFKANWQTKKYVTRKFYVLFVF